MIEPFIRQLFSFLSRAQTTKEKFSELIVLVSRFLRPSLFPTCVTGSQTPRSLAGTAEEETH